MTEWIECTLDKLGEIVGGATPSTKCEDYYGGSIPWITPKDLSSFKGRYITSGERNITEKGLASCSAQMMPKDAVLFTSRAPIGYVAIASQSVCTNQGFKSIVVNEKADPLFVYYLLKYNKDAIEAMGSGTTFKEVSGKAMRAVKVRIPLDVSYQKRIAAVLDSLDTKIENNERINDNLEAQALALFSDFVSQHNEKWEQGKLGDVISSANTGGDAIQKVPIVDYDTGIKCARVGDITNAREFASWAFCSATNSVFDNYKLQAGDILVTRTATLGITQYIPSDISAVYNNGLIRLKTDNNRALPLYVYWAINTSDFMNYINQMNSATSVRPNMKIDYLLNYQLLIPPIEKQIQFVKAVEVLMNAISLNNNERLKLCDFQSTLLNTLSRR